MSSAQWMNSARTHGRGSHSGGRPTASATGCRQTCAPPDSRTSCLRTKPPRPQGKVPVLLATMQAGTHASPESRSCWVADRGRRVTEGSSLFVDSALDCLFWPTANCIPTWADGLRNNEADSPIETNQPSEGPHGPVHYDPCKKTRQVALSRFYASDRS